MNAVSEGVSKFDRLQRKAKDMKFKDSKKSVIPEKASSKIKMEGDDATTVASSYCNDNQSAENIFTQRRHIKQHQFFVEKSEAKNIEKTASVSMTSSADEDPTSNRRQILMEMLKKRAEEHESSIHDCEESTVQLSAPVTICGNKTESLAVLSNRSNEKNDDVRMKHTSFIGICDPDQDLSTKVNCEFSNSKSTGLNDDKSNILKKNREEIHENNHYDNNQMRQHPKNRFILRNIMNRGQRGKEVRKNNNGKGYSKVGQQSNKKIRQQRGTSFPIILRSSTTWRLK